MKVWMSGRYINVDNTHPLAGRMAVKKYWTLKGCEIKILGIRRGVKATAQNAFVAQWKNSSEPFLISRGAFAIKEET